MLQYNRRPTDANYKFLLNHITKCKQSIELTTRYFVPTWEFLTDNQIRRLIERAMQDGILINKVPGCLGRKNSFNVDFDRLKVIYYGWLQDVQFVDLRQKWLTSKAKIIKRASNKVWPAPKEEDFRICSEIRKDFSAYTNEEVISNIVRSYPGIRYMQIAFEAMKDNLITEYNVTPSFKVKKCKATEYYKIGFRPSNSFCNLNKEDGSRQRMLDSYNLIKQKNGDIVSEIYRVERLLNFGIWEESSKDFYSIFLTGNENTPSIKSKYPEFRDFIKETMFAEFMKPRFHSAESAASARFSEYCRKMTRAGKQDKFMQHPERTKKMLAQAINNMHEYCVGKDGKEFKSEIFYWSSLLELFAMEELVSRGYTVFNIYDEIWIQNAQVDDMESVYSRAAEKLLKFYRIGHDTAEQRIKAWEYLVCNSQINAILASYSPGREGINYYYDYNVIINNNRLNNNNNNDVVVSLDMTSGKSIALIPGTSKHKSGWKLSDETKAKMSAAHSVQLNEQVTYCKRVMQSDEYKNILKKKHKQQYLDKEIIAKYGTVSSTKLTRIRKLARGE